MNQRFSSPHARHIILIVGVYAVLVILIQYHFRTLFVPTLCAKLVKEQNIDGLRNRDLKFITLSFNYSGDRAVIDHNCERLSRNRYNFEIHTDDLTQPYCHKCHCVPFDVQNCTCHFPSKSNCNHCNKLGFIVKSIRANFEFVFLDSDLVILKDELMPRLEARTIGFDFLATYGFVTHKEWTYRAQFNSGLMFIRRLDDVDYEKSFALKSKIQTNSDQVVISRFVHENYVRWDVLSLRWHCRYLDRPEHSIDISDCFTFHAHDEIRRKYLANFEWSNTSSKPRSSVI